MECLTEQNYLDMRRHVLDLGMNDFISGNSNFGKFIKRFESDDGAWIDEINRKIEGVD